MRCTARRDFHVLSADDGLRCLGLVAWRGCNIALPAGSRARGVQAAQQRGAPSENAPVCNCNCSPQPSHQLVEHALQQQQRRKNNRIGILRLRYALRRQMVFVNRSGSARVLRHQSSQRCSRNTGKRVYACMYACMHICCLLYTSPSPRDYAASRMPSSA